MLRGSFWLLLCFPHAERANATDRVALIIGCAHYKVANGSLSTPLNDADDIAEKLQKDLGFTVIEKRDATRDDFYDGLTELREQAMTAQVALVYFSGHGIELDGANYCIPVDAMLDKPSQLDSQTIPLQTILRDYLDKTNTGARVVILDACRDNPFPHTKSWRSSKGLRDAMASPGVLAELGPKEMLRGLLISYAAAPGRKAAAFLNEEERNSLYTAFLLKHLDDQGKNLRDIFERVQEEVSTATKERQVPYVNYEGASPILRKLVLMPAGGDEHTNTTEMGIEMVPGTSPSIPLPLVQPPPATPSLAMTTSRPQWPRYRTNPRALGKSNLRVRSGPGMGNPTVQFTPENVIVQQTSQSQMNGPTEWIPIEYQPATGAVIRGFVTADALQRLP
jgi:hypothetical protein